MLLTQEMQGKQFIKDELRIVKQFFSSFFRFTELYRFPIYLAIQLIEEIRPHYDDGIGKIPLHIKVLSALNFYASGSYQRRTGQDALSCVSQTLVSRTIKEISHLIVRHLLPVYVRFPENDEEVTIIQNRYVTLYVI